MAHKHKEIWANRYFITHISVSRKTDGMCVTSSHQLSVPRHNLTSGFRAFRFSAPRVWSLEFITCQYPWISVIPTFRRHLKTFYFQSAYPISAANLA